MKKADIISEIKRTAKADGGVPLGSRRFESETGIDVSDWRGKYWARWGDAVREAGLVPHRFASEAYEQTVLLEKYAHDARELGHLPTKEEIRLNRRRDCSFSSHTAFFRRWKKPVLVEKLLEYCRRHKGYEDIARLCEEYIAKHPQESQARSPGEEQIGFVYLMKSWRFYEVGRSNAPGRREYELAIQLPETTRTGHTIRTDDPSGIEAYWHRRFEAKRKRGEWFELSAADVAAF